MRHGWVLIAIAACGSAQRRADEESQYFSCRERSVSYTASKHIGGDEIGVQMDCEASGPRIMRWRTDKSGHRVADERALKPSDFDKAWKEIDGTGWAYLKDCANGSLDTRDPVYVFDIKDDQQKATFQCQTRVVPYPYNDISDTLDLLASQGRKQLGDDEPAEAKALDHKDKQR
jgi:hypothetical protein